MVTFNPEYLLGTDTRDRDRIRTFEIHSTPEPRDTGLTDEPLFEAPTPELADAIDEFGQTATPPETTGAITLVLAQWGSNPLRVLYQIRERETAADSIERALCRDVDRYHRADLWQTIADAVPREVFPEEAPREEGSLLKTYTAKATHLADPDRIPLTDHETATTTAGRRRYGATGTVIGDIIRFVAATEAPRLWLCQAQPARNRRFGLRIAVLDILRRTAPPRAEPLPGAGYLTANPVTAQLWFSTPSEVTPGSSPLLELASRGTFEGPWLDATPAQTARMLTPPPPALIDEIPEVSGQRPRDRPDPLPVGSHRLRQAPEVTAGVRLGQPWSPGCRTVTTRSVGADEGQTVLRLQPPGTQAAFRDRVDQWLFRSPAAAFVLDLRPRSSAEDDPYPFIQPLLQLGVDRPYHPTADTTPGRAPETFEDAVDTPRHELTRACTQQDLYARPVDDLLPERLQEIRHDIGPDSPKNLVLDGSFREGSWGDGEPAAKSLPDVETLLTAFHDALRVTERRSQQAGLTPWPAGLLMHTAAGECPALTKKLLTLPNDPLYADTGPFHTDVRVALSTDLAGLVDSTTEQSPPPATAEELDHVRELVAAADVVLYDTGLPLSELEPYLRPDSVDSGSFRAAFGHLSRPGVVAALRSDEGWDLVSAIKPRHSATFGEPDTVQSRTVADRQPRPRPHRDTN